MRIIAGHDFYDGVAPYDTDTNRVFVRNSVKDPILFPKMKLYNDIRFTKLGEEPWRASNSLGKTEVHVRHLIFCGYLYNYIEVLIPPKYLYPETYTAPQQLFFWSEVGFRAYLETLRMDLTSSTKHWYWRDMSQAVTQENITDFFTRKLVSPVVWDFLLQNNICIARLEKTRNDEIVGYVNTDDLKEIGFPKIMSAYQTFQELDMFLGTILVKDENKMVSISDRSRSLKAGFDAYSFRNKKHPSKPRAA